MTEEMQPETARILVNISTMKEAGRIEETIKSGYIDPILESIVSWIGVEEDLADSYEKFSKSLSSADERRLANELHVLSSSDRDLLSRKLEEFEALEKEYRKRIQLVKRLTKTT
jgi:hypothetical protein